MSTRYYCGTGRVFFKAKPKALKYGDYLRWEYACLALPKNRQQPKHYTLPLRRKSVERHLAKLLKYKARARA